MIYERFEDIPFEEVTTEYIHRDYLKYMMRGIERGIRNVHAVVHVLLLDGQLIPFSVKSGLYKDSWIHSLTAQYIDEMASELERMALPKLLNSAALTLLSTGRLVFKMTREQTVTVLPSFMSTTLYDQSLPVEAVTRQLTARYPRHAIIFRTVNERQQPLLGQLQSAQYQLLISRAVYLFDPQESHSKNERKDLKKDMKRLKKSHYTVTSELADDDFTRLVELYEQVYLEKYSVYNPHYTATFFKFLYEHLPLKWFVIKDGDQIISFMAVQQAGRWLFPAYFGMDQSIKGLYFMTSGLLYDMAMEQQLFINNSAGAKDYKLARGSRPTLEHHALYIRHLPLMQRLSYQLLFKVMNPLGTYLLKKLQFQ